MLCVALVNSLFPFFLGLPGLPEDGFLQYLSFWEAKGAISTKSYSKQKSRYFIISWTSAQ